MGLEGLGWQTHMAAVRAGLWLKARQGLSAEMFWLSVTWPLYQVTWCLGCDEVLRRQAKAADLYDATWD